MALFQWQKIDPSPEEVEAALRQAGRAAGRRLPTSHDIIGGVAGARMRPSGSMVWGPATPRSGKRRLIAVCWWSDRAGRRHWYVEGDDYGGHRDPHPDWRCSGALHSLGVIAPLHTVIRGDSGDATVLVVCGCGEAGTPDALGWFGDCCGPCFDRRAEGAGLTERLAIHAHRGRIDSLTFSEDGCILSVGYADGRVHRFDPRSGVGSDPVPPGEWCAGIVALPGGRMAVGHGRAEVVCLDVDSGEEQGRTHCPGEVSGLTASRSGDWIAVDMVDVPYILDAWTGERRRGPDDVSEFAFGPEDRLYAYDYDIRGVVSMDVEGLSVRETGLMFGEPEVEDCYRLACSPDGKLIAAGCTGGRVKIGDPASGRWLLVLERPGHVSGLAFTPDGRLLVTGHEGAAVFWDVAAGIEWGLLALPVDGRICNLAFSPDGEHLAVGDDHGIIRLWPWRRLLGC